MAVPILNGVDSVNTADIAANAVTFQKFQTAGIAGGFVGAAGTGNYEHVTYATTRTRLNVADGATANSSDATLLARTNHTGTQVQATISDLPLIASGGSIMTRFNGANVASSSAGKTYYHRVGAYVFCDGEVTVDPTAANAITVIGLSLPIASNFSSTFHLTGSGVHHQTVSAGVEAHSAVSIYAHVVGDRAELTWYPASANNGILRFRFAYEII